MVSFTEAQLTAWWTAVFWPLVRVLAMISAAPLLSHRAIPTRLKLGLALAIVVVLVPVLPAAPAVDIASATGLPMLIGNLMIGLALGFTVRLVFAAIELAGEAIGLQMGLSFGAFFNPAAGTQSNSISSFLGTIALLMFLAIDGHLMLIHAVAESFRLFPVAVGLGADSFRQMAVMGSQIFSLGLSIALPFVAVSLLVNVVLGVMARIAPQFNIFAVGFPLTILVGLGTLFMFLPYIEPPIRMALEHALALWLG
ncbi:MAG: flagellar biosynthetic protein FliR [Burkholderiaceae bacterium]